jgi:drug/metabolite transporter (DMT)-like permease
VLSALAFSLMGVCIQVCAETLPNTMIVFFRNLLGLALVGPLLFRPGASWRERLRTEHPFEHGVRAVAGLGAMYCFFFAIENLPLADALLLNYTLPLFIPFVEALWLGEPMPPRLAWPLIVGFVGVAVILRPGGGLWTAAASVGLLAGALSAVAQTGVRRLTRTEPTLRIIFFFALAATTLSALPLPFTWRMPDRRIWLVILAMGACATIGQILLTRAYAHAPASQVGGFVYAGVVFASLIDWARFGAAPRPGFFLGGLLIALAGVLMLRLAPRVEALSGDEAIA